MHLIGWTYAVAYATIVRQQILSPNHICWATCERAIEEAIGAESEFLSVEGAIIPRPVPSWTRHDHRGICEPSWSWQNPHTGHEYHVFPVYMEE